LSGWSWSVRGRDARGLQEADEKSGREQHGFRGAGGEEASHRRVGQDGELADASGREALEQRTAHERTRRLADVHQRAQVPQLRLFRQRLERDTSATAKQTRVRVLTAITADKVNVCWMLVSAAGTPPPSRLMITLVNAMHAKTTVTRFRSDISQGQGGAPHAAEQVNGTRGRASEWPCRFVHA
jgi:hypothetical protein